VIETTSWNKTFGRKRNEAIKNRFYHFPNKNSILAKILKKSNLKEILDDFLTYQSIQFISTKSS
jgi:hypothetical protein